MQYYPEVREWYRKKKRKKPDAIARARLEGDRADRLPRSHEERGLQRPVQGRALEPVEERAVALRTMVRLPSPAGLTGMSAGESPA